MVLLVFDEVTNDHSEYYIPTNERSISNNGNTSFDIEGVTTYFQLKRTTQSKTSLAIAFFDAIPSKSNLIALLVHVTGCNKNAFYYYFRFITTNYAFVWFPKQQRCVIFLTRNLIFLKQYLGNFTKVPIFKQSIFTRFCMHSISNGV